MGRRDHAHPQGARAPRPALRRGAPAAARLAARQAGNVDFYASTMKVDLAAPARGRPAALPRRPAPIRQRVLLGADAARSRAPDRPSPASTIAPRLRGECEIDLITIMDRAAKNDAPRRHRPPPRPRTRVATAEDLGRLFFTPQQRSALDERRRARVPDKPAAGRCRARYASRRVRPALRRPPPRGQRRSAERKRAGSAAHRHDPHALVRITIGESGSRTRLKPG